MDEMMVEKLDDRVRADAKLAEFLAGMAGTYVGSRQAASSADGIPIGIGTA